MIDFKNIEIRYGDFVAVENLNLSIKEGEFFTLLGPSGCGKTTTLRSLVGFINPHKGSILLNNKDITKVPIEKRGISMVFQSYALFPTLSVYENIAFGLKVKKVSKNKIASIVKDIANKVDLNETHLEKKVSELSGGQQQRVAIARALAIQPKILVLDEPLSNLDAKLRVQLRNELKEMQRKFGITSIYVTHDQEEALTLSDRIAVFNNGAVEQIGTPEEIYNDSKTEFVCNFIGDINEIGPLVKKYSSSINFELGKYNKFYIRVEKVKLLPAEDSMLNDIKEDKDNLYLPGVVIEKEFYGLYTKYTIQCDSDVKIKTIEKGEIRKTLDIGNHVKLKIHRDDILKYI